MKTVQTPPEIIALIEYGREQLDVEVQSAKDRSRQEYLDVAKANYELALALFDLAKPSIPDVIRPFVKLQDVRIEDYERYGVKWNERVLEFHIPDLAPIAMRFCEKRGEEKPIISGWIVAGISQQDWDSDFEICRKAVFSFSYGCNHLFDADVDFYRILLTAEEVAAALPEEQSRLTKNYESALMRQASREEKTAAQKSEEEALFEAIKDDDVAIHVLKAFVLLRDERSTFEQRLNEADEAMYSIEDHWSRKAVSLRRQAEDAERRVKEENDRVRDLEDDLSDAQKKIKSVR